MISSPNLRIDASFSPFTPSFMHRFLISSSDLRIDARGEWFRLQQLLRQRCFASDSILCSRKEEWFRLQLPSRRRSSASDSHSRGCTEESPACIGRRGNDLPRPILIFFAATEHGSACSCRRGDELPHPILIFVVAKKNGSPASAVAGRSSASDSNLRRCKEEWFRLQFIHKDS